MISVLSLKKTNVPTVPAMCENPQTIGGIGAFAGARRQKAGVCESTL